MSTLTGSSAGDVLPEQTYTVTRADLVRYAGASGDFNPIHWSDRVATSVGLPGVIAHGMYTLALAARALDTWAGGPGHVVELGCKFTKPVVVPDDDTGVDVVVARHRQGRHRRRRPGRARGHLRRREGARHAQGGAAWLTGSSCWPTSPRCGSAARPARSCTPRTEQELLDAVRSADAPAPAAAARRRQQPGRRRRRLRRHGRARRDHAASSRRQDTVRRRRASRSPRGSPGTRSSRAPSSEGWVGVEALSGIPGSVGATPIQNVGAYGQEVADTIASVRCWDRVDRVQRTFFAADCGFGYRTSRFKQDPDRYVVLAVTFQLRLGDAARTGPLRRAGPHARRRAGGRARPSTDVRDAVLGLRGGKGMVLDAADHDTWSAGSFFTNPLLDDAADAARGRAALGAARRHREDQRRLAHRARRLRQGLRQRPGRAVRQAHAGAHQPRRRHAPPTCSPSRRGAAGVHERFGVRLVNEPVLVGCALPEPCLSALSTDVAAGSLTGRRSISTRSRHEHAAGRGRAAPCR